MYLLALVRLAATHTPTNRLRRRAHDHAHDAEGAGLDAEGAQVNAASKLGKIRRMPGRYSSPAR